MRPPRNILLICNDADRMAELRFLITTRGNYLVLAGLSTYPPKPELAIVVDDISAAQLVVNTLPDVPLIAIVPGYLQRKLVVEYPAPSRVVSDTYPVADLLELIKVLSYRKRGPKPHGVMADGERVSA